MNDSLIRGEAKLMKICGKHMGDDTEKYKGWLFCWDNDTNEIVLTNPTADTVHRLPMNSASILMEKDCNFRHGVGVAMEAVCEFLNRWDDNA